MCHSLALQEVIPALVRYSCYQCLSSIPLGLRLIAKYPTHGGGGGGGGGVN